MLTLSIVLAIVAHTAANTTGMLVNSLIKVATDRMIVAMTFYQIGINIKNKIKNIENL